MTGPACCHKCHLDLFIWETGWTPKPSKCPKNAAGWIDGTPKYCVKELRIDQINCDMFLFYNFLQFSSYLLPTAASRRRKVLTRYLARIKYIMYIKRYLFSLTIFIVKIAIGI